MNESFKGKMIGHFSMAINSQRVSVHDESFRPVVRGPQTRNGRVPADRTAADHYYIAG